MKPFNEYFKELKPRRINGEDEYVIVLSITDWQEGIQLLDNYERKNVCPLCKRLDNVYRKTFREVFNEYQKNEFVNISEAIKKVDEVIARIKREG